MEQPPNDQEKLAGFIAEISALRDAEASTQQTANFSDPKFNPAELSAEDMHVWEKIKDSSITMAEVSAYKIGAQGSGNLSRALFGAFVANRAQAIIGNRELDEREKKE